MQFLKSLSFVLFSLTFVSAAQAVPLVVTPADLNPGDQYRLVFVSDAKTDLLEGGNTALQNVVANNTAYYNNFITDQANQSSELSALNIGWNAIYGTSFLNARENTGTQYTNDPTNPNNDPVDDVPIYLVNGALVAGGNDQFWLASNNVFINVTQSGTVIGNERIWSATRVTGNWQSPTFSPRRDAYGLSGSLDTKHFIGSNVRPRAELYRMYGMSDVLTVASVPAPGALMLLGLGLLGMAVRRQVA